MFLIKIADLTVEIQNRYRYIEKQCSDYICNGEATADFSVSATEVELAAENKKSDCKYDSGYLESLCLYRKIALRLPQYDAFLMHGSVISFDGCGIIFLAKSGVGKSTHTALWKQQYDSSVEIINGDKPIVRFIDGIPYAYGTPWAGKENWQINRRVELENVCFIERDSKNSVKKIEPSDRLDSLMQQVLHPGDPITAMKMLDLLDRLTKTANFWVIKCNPTFEAAVTAHKAIILGENYEA